MKQTIITGLLTIGLLVGCTNNEGVNKSNSKTKRGTKDRSKG